jgi:hypothetical protein
MGIARNRFPTAHADVIRAAFADEAFALHFLEDSFAAGHVAGNWGSTAGKGTHAYYSVGAIASGETVAYRKDRIDS